MLTLVKKLLSTTSRWQFVPATKFQHSLPSPYPCVKENFTWEALIFPDPRFFVRFQATKGAQVQGWIFWVLGETGRGLGLAQRADALLYLWIESVTSCQLQHSFQKDMQTTLFKDLV